METKRGTQVPLFCFVTSSHDEDQREWFEERSFLWKIAVLYRFVHDAFYGLVLAQVVNVRF